MAASIYVAELSFYLVRNQEWSTVYAGCKLWISSKLSIFPSKSCMDPQGKNLIWLPEIGCFTVSWLSSYTILLLVANILMFQYVPILVGTIIVIVTWLTCFLRWVYLEPPARFIFIKTFTFAVKFLSWPPFWWIESWTPYFYLFLF